MQTNLGAIINELILTPAAKHQIIGGSNSVALAASTQNDNLIQITNNLAGLFVILSLAVRYNNTNPLAARNQIQIRDTQSNIPLTQGYVPISTIGMPDGGAVENQGRYVLIKPRMISQGQTITIGMNASALAINPADINVSLNGVSLPQGDNPWLNKYGSVLGVT